MNSRVELVDDSRKSGPADPAILSYWMDGGTEHKGVEVGPDPKRTSRIDAWPNGSGKYP